MKIYIVFLAFPYEGECIKGIYDSAEKANQKVLHFVSERSDPSLWIKQDTENGLLCYKKYNTIYAEEHEVE